jgi:hypothetical protein
MRIIITEEQKKKLFIPRKLDGEDSRWERWNKEQPTITLDSKIFKLNQYDPIGNQIGLWIENHETIEQDYIKTKSVMKNIFDNLEVFKKPNYTNYMIGDYIILQDLKNGYIRYNYEKIWLVLLDQYPLKDSQVNGLIKIWMEMTYKLGSLTPWKCYPYQLYKWR